MAIGAEAEEKAYAACAVAGDPPEMGPDLDNRSVPAAGTAALVAAPAEVTEDQVAKRHLGAAADAPGEAVVVGRRARVEAA